MESKKLVSDPIVRAISYQQLIYFGYLKYTVDCRNIIRNIFSDAYNHPCNRTKRTISYIEKDLLKSEMITNGE